MCVFKWYMHGLVISYYEPFREVYRSDIRSKDPLTYFPGERWQRLHRNGLGMFGVSQPTGILTMFGAILAFRNVMSSIHLF